MTNRSNYRVKLDLSNHHRDARRISWIYVDSTNVRSINHLKQHIVDIFNIPEPFHLMLGGHEYLPPNEDVRVIKENELIAVVPGPGMENLDSSIASTETVGWQPTIVKHTEPLPVMVQTKEDRHHRDNCKISNDVEDQKSISDMVDNSVPDESVIDVAIIDKAQEVTASSTPTVSSASKVSFENITMNNTMDNNCDVPVHKRRRIRRKRSKAKSDEKTGNSQNFEKKIKKMEKPNALELAVAPTGKHIHFHNIDEVPVATKIPMVVDDRENEPVEDAAKNKSIPKISSPASFTESATSQLSTLLALKQYSTPLMFVNTKPTCVDDDNSKIVTNDKFHTDTENVETNGNGDVAKPNEEPIHDYANFDPDKYPSLDTDTKLDDVVAFKILKIGNSYTPEISDYIVARTTNWCPKESAYTFEILSGRTQIKPPSGKFSMMEDDNADRVCDTMTASFSELIDPRLVYRK